jgi:hypothetical protein
LAALAAHAMILRISTGRDAPRHTRRANVAIRPRAQQSHARKYGARLHMERVRIHTLRPSAGASFKRRTTMYTSTNTVRRPARWALLPAVAMIGVLAGMTNAFAFDQQATDDALDNAINWRAASGGGHSGAYAQVPAPAPHHRHHR